MDIKETLKYLKMRESAISMILGALVIVVGGVIFINYLSNRPNTEREIIKIGDENTLTENSHVVERGETLSLIAREYYGDPTYWTRIAEANNLENSDSITEGQVLVIPTIEPTGQIALTSPNANPIVSEPTEAQVQPSPIETVITTQAPETPSPTPTVITSDGEGAAATEARTHTVAEGEDLWSIAETFYKSGYNWVDIAQANKLSNANKIEVGQNLIIPNTEPKVATVSDPDPAISGASYIVLEGDNLWDIAVRAYGDGYKWPEIARENNLTNPGIIHPGQTLSLPR